MPLTKEKSVPQILYSCYDHKSREGEHFVPAHIFSHIIAGTSLLNVSGVNLTTKDGDFLFYRKNQLSKYTKFPPENGEYKSVSLYMDQDTLRQISAEYNLHTDGAYTGENVVRLTSNPLFTNFIDSLRPYLNDKSSNRVFAALKVKEMVMILLQTNPELKNVLFDFSEPGKIDLEAFMNQNYKYNVDMSRFAYLTGRSLATFKRDFEKIYHTSPSKWLQQKRLNDAYYLLKEKGWKTSDVYLEVGFKDFSHFSFAFKKAYGVSPSRLV